MTATDGPQSEAEMNEQATAIAEDVRARILQHPDVILEDPDVMRALVAANDEAMGQNIVDLRGVAMDRLETRLGRLEETHRSVIAAAYENLAGMNQVHRAILAFLEPTEFEGFLTALGTDVAEILRVTDMRLVLESHEAGHVETPVRTVLTLAEPGFIAEYTGHAGANRNVVLRRTTDMSGAVFGAAAEWLASEACIILDFGDTRLPGMLVFASEDQHQFGAHQGTDLLSFMGSVFERTMRRWLE